MTLHFCWQAVDIMNDFYDYISNALKSTSYTQGSMRLWIYPLGSVTITTLIHMGLGISF